MKKLLALSLAAILIVSLVACGEKMKKNGDSDSDGEKMMAPVDLVMGNRILRRYIFRVGRRYGKCDQR